MIVFFCVCLFCTSKFSLHLGSDTDGRRDQIEINTLSKKEICFINHAFALSYNIKIMAVVRGSFHSYIKHPK